MDRASAARPGGLRIAAVISSLACGGSERAMAMLATGLAQRGHQVTLVTIAPPETDFYAVPPEVSRHALRLAIQPRHLLEAVSNNLRRWRRLRQALRASRPDLVISFVAETNILTLAACLGLRVPVIVSERVDPRHQAIGRVRESLRRWLYPHASAVVVQTERVLRWVRAFVPGAEVRVIPNAVEPPAQLPGAGSRSPAATPVRPGERLVVGMGRLSRQKGFDVLIRAFARCAAEHPGWTLVILGEGEERGALLALGESLRLGGRLRLPGRQRDAGGLLRGADLFVLSSRFEGFPNALLEAMACGLAVIAADCPSGPAEIVEPGVNGLLVPPEDVDALAVAMDHLMSEEPERRRLGRRAAEVVERFSVGRVIDLWQELIWDVASRRGGAAGGGR